MAGARRSGPGRAVRARPEAVPGSDGGIDRRRIGPITKAHIEKEAVRLFNESGFRASTMRHIADACNLTPAAFYNHFDSKERLLSTIITSAFDEMDAAVSLATEAAPSDPVSQLSATVRAMTRWIADNPHHARLARRELRELEPSDRARMRARSRRELEQIEAILCDGVDAGAFSLATMGKGVEPIPTTAIIIMDVLADVPHSLLQLHMDRNTIADILVVLVERIVGCT